MKADRFSLPLLLPPPRPVLIPLVRPLVRSISQRAEPSSSSSDTSRSDHPSSSSVRVRAVRARRSTSWSRRSVRRRRARSISVLLPKDGLERAEAGAARGGSVVAGTKVGAGVIVGHVLGGRGDDRVLATYGWVRRAGKQEQKTKGDG
jgi:hypothetical protein